MKNKYIIPTVFSLNKKEFNQKFEKLIKVANKIQIDFMDGKFVKSKSVQLKDVPNLAKYKKEFEAHLMVKKPENWFAKCKQKGFKRIIFHIESCKASQFSKAINILKKLKIQFYIAINPGTSLSKIEPFVKENSCEGILFLGVNPGKEGQKLSPKIFSRIKKIKKINSKMIVQVDGGVNEKNTKKLSKSGADFLNSGSFISGSDNPKRQLILLEKIFKSGK